MILPFSNRYGTYESVRRTHRGKPFKDLVNSAEWKKFLVENLDKIEYQTTLIPNNMENRVDLIALAAFGTERLWWLICTVNGIIDPTTELIAGKQIRIPIIR